MPGPDVELRWWEGCPSTERARRELRDALDELGLTATQIRETRIDTDAAARGARFVGSPTILIDGEDVDPPDVEEPFRLSCRVYRRRDGSVSPTPDPENVRDALRRALARTGGDR